MRRRRMCRTGLKGRVLGAVSKFDPRRTGHSCVRSRAGFRTAPSPVCVPTRTGRRSRLCWAVATPFGVPNRKQRFETPLQKGCIRIWVAWTSEARNERSLPVCVVHRQTRLPKPPAKTSRSFAQAEPRTFIRIEKTTACRKSLGRGVEFPHEKT